MRKIILIIIISVVIGLIVWIALPAGLTFAGLHPEYQGPRPSFPGGKALIITTSHNRLGGNGDKTGVFASEMTAPYYEFTEAGMNVDLASIDGGRIPIDPLSFVWAIRSSYDDRYLDDSDFQEKVAHSLTVEEVDFTGYDMIYLAGGWWTAYDLGTSQALADGITRAYAANTVIGGVCHGPLGLLLARDETGAPLVKGRRLTAVTDKQVEELGITMTPHHPERELRAAGAVFESETRFRDLFANHVVVDGLLVTGQNQNAGAEVAIRMMEIAKGENR